MSTDHPSTPIADAAAKAITAAGGGTVVARACGVTKAAVSQWKKAGVPGNHVLRLAALAKVPPQDLRPDLVQPVAA